MALQLGLYDPGCPPRLASWQALERRLGARVRLVSWYQAWGSGFKDCRPELILTAHRRGLTPLITWEPWQLPADLPPGAPPQDQPTFSLKRIASGLYDDYGRAWARALARTGKPVILRPLHEMNGNWYPWGGTVNGNHPRDFPRAWRHLRRLFREEGAANVAWVWCPYAHSVPETPANAPEVYFPGAAEVDWLGLDGYNWGTSRPESAWQTFPELFSPAYQRLTALAPDKPVMIAEIGAAEPGGDKAAWIREALEVLPDRFPRVKALVWFNVNKECDWRLNSSPASLAAFREQAWRFS